jgi:hypothetical protein
VSFRMLCHLALVRTDVSEELSGRWLLVTASVVPSSPILLCPDEGGAKFLPNLGSYKSYTV